MNIQQKLALALLVALASAIGTYQLFNRSQVDLEVELHTEPE
jgi:hypothetical protein